MSKARTLADFISDGSEFADGTISVAEVSGAAPLASPTFTGTVNVTTLDASSYVYTDHLIVRPDAPNYIQLDGSYPDGTWNTALGERAGDAWATGSNNNVAIGYASLSNSGTADYNTAVGAISLGSLYGSTAQHNTGIGSEAGKGITTGISNTAIGSASMANFSANLTGNYNVGVGRLSSYSNTSGSFNVAIGTEALRENETGESNTAVGYTAGYNSTGTSNTFIGSNRQYLKGAGYDMTTGDKNVIIGPFSGNSGGLDIRTSDNNIVLADGDGTPRLHIDSSGNADITGSTATTNVNLNAIAATISDTAVDIFVYDTRKDSDGGAWRKRTQHTSWYNETLNTATRGSRKEFPAVAVIVTKSDRTFTIYDGDDPDLPMWLDSDTRKWYWDGVTTKVEAKNGIITLGVVGGSHLWSGNGVYLLNLISEKGQAATLTHSGNYSPQTFNLATGILDLDTSANRPFTLVNYVVNDVAMTVLPNAPIDAATGLPVPTIAVATDGGVSVIKDDGTVVDLTTGDIYDNYRTVDFTKNNRLMYTTGTGTSMAYTADIPSSDYNLSYYNTTGTGSARNEYFAGLHGGGTLSAYPVRFHGGNVSGQTVSTSAGDSIAFGTYSSNATEEMGLTLLDEIPDNPNQSSVVWLNSEYNTGHMVGAIKLATLSDTDDTNVTGSELVTNGTFDSNITGWTAYNATLSHVNGAIRVADNGGYTKAYQAISTVVGKKYTVTAEVVAITGLNSALAVGSENPETNAWGNATGQISSSTTGVLSATFTATATTMYVELGSEGTNSVDYDNVSVRLAEEDRSVNGNGLQVFGTVTKSAVATGADLVGYSGFSGSNYLEQPYNSNITFGTGDFCIMGWVKKDGTAAYRRFFSYEAAGGNQNDNDAINIKFGNENDSTNGKLYAYLGSAESVIPVSNTDHIGDNNWAQFVLLRRSGVYELYINSVLIETLASTQTKGSSAHKIRIGNGVSGSEDFVGGSAALFRVSKTAPSPEQIKKIYEDEKVLFQDNAQATLYGSSDAVTALAYDDSTNLLHVGTSAGRSVFQGLRRVDNTTTAVGAAISASNGLVADE